MDWLNGWVEGFSAAATAVRKLLILGLLAWLLLGVAIKHELLGWELLGGLDGGFTE